MVEVKEGILNLRTDVEEGQEEVGLGRGGLVIKRW